MVLKNLDAAQRVLLRDLLVKEQGLMEGTLRLTLYGRFKDEALARYDTITRTLEQLEEEHG